MISGPFLGTTSIKPGISRAAGCLLARLSATSYSSDALELHAFADKTSLIRYADTFHFLAPSEFLQGGGCSDGTYAGIVSPTRVRPPRRLRLRSRGPTSRKLGRRQSARLRQYQPGRRRDIRSTGRNARLATCHSREEGPRFCQSPRQKRQTTQSRSSASSMTRASP